jgi:hypothetical protein
MRRVPSGIERGNVGGVRTTATGLLANATLRRANGDVHLAGLHAGASGGHTLGDRPGAHGARGGATYAGGREGGGEGGHVVLSAVEGDTRWLDRRSGEERDSFRLQDSAMAGTDASASGRGGPWRPRYPRKNLFRGQILVTRLPRGYHFQGSQTHIPKIAKTSRASTLERVFRGHKTRWKKSVW